MVGRKASTSRLNECVDRDRGQRDAPEFSIREPPSTHYSVIALAVLSPFPRRLPLLFRVFSPSCADFNHAR